MARAHKGVAMTALTVRRCDAVRTTFDRKVDPKSSGTCLFTSREPRLPVGFSTSRFSSAPCLGRFAAVIRWLCRLVKRPYLNMPGQQGQNSAIKESKWCVCVRVCVCLPAEIRFRFPCVQALLVQARELQALAPPSRQGY